MMLGNLFASHVTVWRLPSILYASDFDEAVG